MIEAVVQRCFINRSSWKFCKIYMKIPMLVSFQYSRRRLHNQQPHFPQHHKIFVNSLKESLFQILHRSIVQRYLFTFQKTITILLVQNVQSAQLSGQRFNSGNESFLELNSYMKSELSVAIAQQIFNCSQNGWKWQRGVTNGLLLFLLSGDF